MARGPLKPRFVVHVVHWAGPVQFLGHETTNWGNRVFLGSGSTGNGISRGLPLALRDLDPCLSSGHFKGFQALGASM